MQNSIFGREQAGGTLKKRGRGKKEVHPEITRIKSLPFKTTGKKKTGPKDIIVKG